jgi:hypothetical protein
MNLATAMLFSRLHSQYTSSPKIKMAASIPISNPSIKAMSVPLLISPHHRDARDLVFE